MKGIVVHQNPKNSFITTNKRIFEIIFVYLQHLFFVSLKKKSKFLRKIFYSPVVKTSKIVHDKNK
jgi:hypothetical protein